MIRTFRSASDVLRSGWASSEGLAPCAKSTTDRVMRSTKLEDSIYKDLRTGDEVLDEVEKVAAEKLHTFPALARDVFQSFYSLSPRKNPEENLSTIARKFNSHILSHVTEQDDYPTLKNICEGRELLSYEASSEFVARTADSLDGLMSDLGGDKGSLHTLEKLETAKNAAAENLSQLIERQKMSSVHNDMLERALVSAANQLDSKQKQVDAVSKMIDTSLLQQSDQTKDVVATAVQAAREKAEETQSIIGAWSDDPADMKRNAANEALLAKVRKSPALKDISKYLGRFREILAQGRKNGFAYGRGENYSLELGCSISRAITSELAMLATPETIPLFLRKYQTKQLKQYQRREPIYKGLGDIICCLDESSSTEGDAAAWGKAVAMALLEIAAQGNRRFALIHFAGSNSCRVDTFLPGTYTLDDKLSAVEFFLGGGTNFERPMREAMQLMEQQGFENADIVFITDGECQLSEECHEEILLAQEQFHFTITGILLDQGTLCFDFTLKSFCRKIYRTSELTGDEIASSIIGNRV